jgi:hypothetical protein
VYGGLIICIDERRQKACYVGLDAGKRRLPGAPEPKYVRIKLAKLALKVSFTTQ